MSRPESYSTGSWWRRGESVSGGLCSELGTRTFGAGGGAETLP